MKPIHAFMCLILWRCVAVVESGCTALPQVENAYISDSSVKANYDNGDSIHFVCRPGYVSTRRIVYQCNDPRWTTSRLIKCLPKQCELPEDIANGHYEIVDGTDFVFGTSIKYTCKAGYSLVGRSDTRQCMSNGWSDRVPSCEVVKCFAAINATNMIVSGLEDDGSVSYGHILHFKCESSDLTLKGEAEVTCLSNGNWSRPFPTCEGEKLHSPTLIESTQKPATGHCGPPPTIEFGDVIGFRAKVYRNGASVTYQCYQSYKPDRKLTIQCKNGNWMEPPKCLKPCTLNLEDMEKLGISLSYGGQRKLYIPHDDWIHFKCRAGKKPAGVEIKRFCRDGEIDLQVCH